MKAAGVVILVISSYLVAHAQPTRLDKFISKIKDKNYSSDLKLLRKTLNGSHREFLKNYKAYSVVDDAFRSGNFDCLSGTLLLSSIFEKLGIEYKVYETNYHIFLIVQTAAGEAIVETTDKNHGLITNQSEVESRLKLYKEFGKGSAMYLSEYTIFNQVNRKQMEGLMLFNQSVSKYLAQDFFESVRLLEQAKEAYNSPRISPFSKIVTQQLAVSDLESDSKNDLIRRLKLLGDEKISLASIASH